MQFCQNPVECQPVLPHVQTSHGMLNIFVAQHAIQFLNMRVCIFINMRADCQNATCCHFWWHTAYSHSLQHTTYNITYIAYSHSIYIIYRIENNCWLLTKLESKATGMKNNKNIDKHDNKINNKYNKNSNKNNNYHSSAIDGKILTKVYGRD